MANAGPDTNSCEFFVTLAPTNRLNYLHSVFGRTVRGLEVLAQIRQDDPVAIKIVRVGAAARAFKADAATFAALAAAAKKYSDLPFATKEPSPASHFDDPQKLPLLGHIRHIRGIALNQYDGRGHWRNTLEKRTLPPRSQNPLVSRDFQVGPSPGRRPVVAYTVYLEPILTETEHRGRELPHAIAQRLWMSHGGMSERCAKFGFTILWIFESDDFKTV